MQRTQTKHLADYLTRDHERLHALLSAASAGKLLDVAKFAAFRAGLLRHIAIEEKLILPAARRAQDGVPIERAHELRVDHAALTSLLVPTPDLALCGEIASLLLSHDAKEEGPGGVYAECETRIGPVESEALAARAVAFPEVRVAAHFDGPGVYRTATLALASAQRLKKSVRS